MTLKQQALLFLSPVQNIKTNSISSSLSTGIKDLLIQSGYDTNQVYVGATLNHSQLNTKVSDLFLKEFTYSTQRIVQNKQESTQDPVYGIGIS